MDISLDQLLAVLFAKADINRIPLAGSFELTSRCTLDCKMCYVHRRECDRSAIEREKDTAFWIDLATKAKDAGMLVLLLTGGEPLLRKDFDEIYTACKKLGMIITVNTNATLIDENKIRLFKELPPQKLCITLYGASEETYGNLCDNAEAYRKVTDSIRKIHEAGIPIKLNYSITPQNVHETEAAYEFAKELDVPFQAVSYMFPPVRIGGEAVRLSAEDAAMAQFRMQRLTLGEDFTKKIESDSQIPEHTDCSDRINCRAGASTFWVNWQGEMTPCGMMAEPKIPITDFTDAWKRICDETKKILLPKECLKCEHRRICDMCAAVSKAETGRSDAVPDYACKKAHEYTRLCKEFLNQAKQ
ncbi:MAG: radical SAM protein [Clostridia bacterium]|nr:radical SAM protein [Clostridia bacterium]